MCVCVCVCVCVFGYLSGRDYVIECAGGRVERRPKHVGANFKCFSLKCMSWNNNEEIETTFTVQQ